jgi:hypothetical protein
MRKLGCKLLVFEGEEEKEEKICRLEINLKAKSYRHKIHYVGMGILWPGTGVL